MIRGDKLYPGVEFLLFVVEYELDAVMTPEVCRTALILFLDHLALPFNAYIGLVQAKLPSIERSAIPRGCTLWYVELQTRPIESYGLADRPNIRLLERQEDAKTS